MEWKKVNLPIGPEVKVEGGGEDKECAGVEHEGLRVGVEGGAVRWIVKKIVHRLRDNVSLLERVHAT